MNWYTNRHNYPIVFWSKENLAHYKDGSVEAIFSDEFINSATIVALAEAKGESDSPVRLASLNGEFFQKAFMSDEIKFSVSWETLTTPIGDRELYVYPRGNSEYMSCDPRSFRFEKTTFVHSVQHLVEHTPEETLLDVVKNAFKYNFIEGTGFVKIQDETLITKRMMKPIIQSEITRNIGNEFDRLADHSRLIIFMLDRMKSLLSEEDLLALQIMMQPASTDALNRIAIREKEIANIINESYTV